MGRKQLNTPRSQVRSALRQLFLRSRERAAALKAAGNCCEECGKKASKAKGREVQVEVHHRAGNLNWDLLLDHIQRHLLCDPQEMMVLCKKCHHNFHDNTIKRS